MVVHVLATVHPRKIPHNLSYASLTLDIFNKRCAVPIVFEKFDPVVKYERSLSNEEENVFLPETSNSYEREVCCALYVMSRIPSDRYYIASDRHNTTYLPLLRKIIGDCASIEQFGNGEDENGIEDLLNNDYPAGVVIAFTRDKTTLAIIESKHLVAKPVECVSIDLPYGELIYPPYMHHADAYLYYVPVDNNKPIVFTTGELQHSRNYHGKLRLHYRMYTDEKGAMRTYSEMFKYQCVKQILEMKS